LAGTPANARWTHTFSQGKSSHHLLTRAALKIRIYPFQFLAESRYAGFVVDIEDGKLKNSLPDNQMIPGMRNFHLTAMQE
jgi:hypothetical protein